MDIEPARFVRESLARGIARTEIEKALKKAGWPREQIDSALAGFAEDDFPVPVPRPRPYLSAREAFLYLFLFTSLYISAFSLGSLMFEFIERAYPDLAVQRPWATYSANEVRWSIARLVVAFPIFLFLSRLIHRDLSLDPAKRTSRTRKWLTYIALFIAASILIGDLVALIYNVLGGELTIRFVLKTLTVGVIAGAIFGYYLRDLRRDEQEG